MERLQRVIAAAGIASRRKAEVLIVEGRVRVDGQVVTELGTRVDAATQKIEVDGKIIPTQRHRYILLNKPRGYITTTSDERGRNTVMDLVQTSERIVPVGRLDRQTEGLLLLTNDGLVAHRVMHPSYMIDKEYEALLDGHPPPAALERLRRGIIVDGERTQPEMVRPIRNVEDGTVVRIIIHEGRNRIVRRMFEEVGYPVLQLVRTRIGPLQLGEMPRGYFRDLREGELIQLREALHITDEDIEEQKQAANRPRPRPTAGPSRPTGPSQRTPVARRPRPSGDQRGSSGGRPPQRPQRFVDQQGGDQRPARRDDRSTERRPPRRDDDQRTNPRFARQDRDSGGRSNQRRDERNPRGPRDGQRRDQQGPRDNRRRDQRTQDERGTRGKQDPQQRNSRDSAGDRRGIGGPGRRTRKPPVHNRNRRPGGRREEHGR
ncbi:MAG: pseudouridine synthase [Thermomicrobiales bacterium]|nr:pseudouridine synthase [Thermomicrobiales bacterium]